MKAPHGHAKQAKSIAKGPGSPIQMKAGAATPSTIDAIAVLR